MRESGLSNVALAKRLYTAEGTIRRPLDLDHHSRIETITDALHNVFHCEIVTTMVAA